MLTKTSSLRRHCRLRKNMFHNTSVKKHPAVVVDFRTHEIIFRTIYPDYKCVPI